MDGPLAVGARVTEATPEQIVAFLMRGTMTDIAIMQMLKERDAEIERLNIRIRQDAEAALQYLNEIDRLREDNERLRIKVPDRDKLLAEIGRLRELNDQLTAALKGASPVAIQAKRQTDLEGPVSLRSP